eukprot:Skav220180  [mRNA]  locus=scaffold1271:310930:312116:+ [translate_table: standard]
MAVEQWCERLLGSPPGELSVLGIFARLLKVCNSLGSASAPRFVEGRLQLPLEEALVREDELASVDSRSNDPSLVQSLIQQDPALDPQRSVMLLNEATKVLGFWETAFPNEVGDLMDVQPRTSPRSSSALVQAFPPTYKTGWKFEEFGYNDAGPEVFQRFAKLPVDDIPVSFEVTVPEGSDTLEPWKVLCRAAGEMLPANEGTFMLQCLYLQVHLWDDEATFSEDSDASEAVHQAAVAASLQEKMNLAIKRTSTAPANQKVLQTVGRTGFIQKAFCAAQHLPAGDQAAVDEVEGAKKKRKVNGEEIPKVVHQQGVAYEDVLVEEGYMRMDRDLSLCLSRMVACGGCTASVFPLFPCLPSNCLAQCVAVF